MEDIVKDLNAQQEPPQDQNLNFEQIGLQEESTQVAGVEDVSSSVSDDDEAPECKICFVESSVGNRLISPCNCSGTLKYIHKTCLMTWMDTWNKDRMNCDLCGKRMRYAELKPLEEVSTDFILFCLVLQNN